MRTPLTLALSLFTFLLVQFLIFHTGLYASIAQPDASTGVVQTYVGNEIQRHDFDAHQVVGIGDSRMGFFPRLANQMTPGSPYTFSTISLGGTSPRCWYYMLRAADPKANRYSAIMIGMDSYDDPALLEDYSDRLEDLNYLIPLLGWRDIAEFASSYHEPAFRFTAMKGILLKGLVYKIDFQRLLLDPVKRWSDVQLYRGSHNWYYNFEGGAENVSNVHIDFQKRTLEMPPATSAVVRGEFQYRFLDPLPEDNGRHSAYLHYWLGKIVDRYRGSRTKIIFLRLPRGPFIRPDQPPVNPNASVREFARSPGVILAPEHLFDDLEKPEDFVDPYHLNSPGFTRFSLDLAKEVTSMLGPPPESRTVASERR